MGVGDKLYFNLNPEIAKRWNENLAANLRKAEANWAAIADKAPGELK